MGQCGDNRYYPEFEILPVPFFSLGGGVEANLSIKLSYGYISCDFDFGGEYKAVLGKYSYIASKGVVDKKKQKERNQPEGGRIDAFPELPGGLNVISKVLNNAGDFADDYRAKGKPDLLMEKYSTYFEFFLKAGAKAEGVVLRAKEYTPDLSLDFGGGEVSIGGGIRVQVEIVDILLAWLSTYIPDSYQPLVNVRKQLARGETVSGECFAILSGVGMIDRTWKIGSMGKSKLASITIPANESDDYDIDFSAEILDKTSAQIIAKLEVALRPEIKVWTVTGKAGVEGTAHTQLLWQWKQDPELGEVHRFYYEGLVLAYKKYAEISIKGKGGGTRKAGVNQGGNSDPKVEHMGTSIEDKISKIENEFSDIKCASGQSDDCSNGDQIFDAEFPLIPPSVKDFNENSPVWKTT